MSLTPHNVHLQKRYSWQNNTHQFQSFQKILKMFGSTKCHKMQLKESPKYWLNGGGGGGGVGLGHLSIAITLVPLIPCEQKYPRANFRGGQCWYHYWITKSKGKISSNFCSSIYLWVQYTALWGPQQLSHSMQDYSWSEIARHHQSQQTQLLCITSHG